MRFALSPEQRAFAESIDALLTTADVAAATRAWGQGNTTPGLDLWRQVADLGLPALLVSADLDGIEGTPLDLAVAFEVLGRHGVPGPWIESVALAPPLLAGGSYDDVLRSLAGGGARVTIAAPPHTPYALDVEAATHTYLLDDRGLTRAEAVRGLRSVDDSRHLHEVRGTGATTAVDEAARSRALDLAALACAAMQLGAGERMLHDAVTYAGQRRQFGTLIGEYQAIKHALADVKVALDFARPLVHGAAHELGSGSDIAGRDVSAAKVAATRAADLAARTALQTHGAIGYTLEHDLSIFILRTRALSGAWGTPSHHRARVLAHLTSPTTRHDSEKEPSHALRAD